MTLLTPSDRRNFKHNWRMETLIAPLLPLYERERRAGRAVALAVVVHTTGSTYRKPGALMLIAADGQYAGLLSGGCLESDLREHALQVMASGKAKLITYDTRGSDDLLWGLGVGCEGAMQILLLRVGPENCLAAPRAVRCGPPAPRAGGRRGGGGLARTAPCPPAASCCPKASLAVTRCHWAMQDAIQALLARALETGAPDCPGRPVRCPAGAGHAPGAAAAAAAAGRRDRMPSPWWILRPAWPGALRCTTTDPPTPSPSASPRPNK